MQKELDIVLSAIETGLRSMLAHLAQQGSMNKEEIEEIYARLFHLNQLMGLVQQTLVVNWPEKVSIPAFKLLKESN